MVDGLDEGRERGRSHAGVVVSHHLLLRALGLRDDGAREERRRIVRRGVARGEVSGLCAGDIDHPERGARAPVAAENGLAAAVANRDGGASIERGEAVVAETANG